MLDTILNSIGGNVVNTMAEKAGISVDQAKSVLPLAQESLQSGLMEQVTSGNVAGLTSMFNSGSTELENNSIFSGIKTMFVKSIVSKVGLPESVAGVVAGTGLTDIVGQISGMAKGDDGVVTEEGLMQKLGVGGGVAASVTNVVKDKLGSITGGLF